MMDEKRPVGRPRKEQQPQFEAAPDNTPNISPHEGTPELNPRARILAELSERSNLRADEEASEPLPPSDDEPVPDIETPAETPETPEEEVPAETPAEITAAPEFNPNQEYELVVDGKPIKVKGSQILERGKAAIQKEIAADYKLEVATNLLNEAKALQIPREEAKTDVLTPEQLAEIVQFGTKEQAAEAIKYIMEKAAQPKKDAVEAKHLPQIVDDQIAFNEAKTFLQTEYKDLMDDADMRSLFSMKENGMRNNGDKRSYKELYKVIGDELRTKFNRPVPNVAVKTMEQKKEAKAAAPSVPRLASTRMETPTDKKAPTTQEIIDQMRAKRGQRPHATIN